MVSNNAQRYGSDIPTDNRYDGWTWRQIKAAITGGSDMTQSHVDSINDVSKPESLREAARIFLFTQRVLEKVRRTIDEHSKAVAGPDGPWKGPAADSFMTGMDYFGKEVRSHIDQIADNPSGAYPIPQGLHAAGNKLADAIWRIEAIDSHYANEAKKAGASVHNHADRGGDLVHISEKPEIVKMMTAQMRDVIVGLAGNYDLTYSTVQPTPPEPTFFKGGKPVSGDPNALRVGAPPTGPGAPGSPSGPGFGGIDGAGAPGSPAGSGPGGGGSASPASLPPTVDPGAFGLSADPAGPGADAAARAQGTGGLHTPGAMPTLGAPPSVAPWSPGGGGPGALPGLSGGVPLPGMPPVFPGGTGGGVKPWAGGTGPGGLRLPGGSLPSAGGVKPWSGGGAGGLGGFGGGAGGVGGSGSVKPWAGAGKGPSAGAAGGADAPHPTGTGPRSTSGRGGTGPGGSTAPGAGGYPMAPPMGGAGGGNQQERERTTWLVEDEEVWGAAPALPPRVIGRDD
ncbi:hypothetical protein [Allokutzneria oryzae]|uniref:PPE domain-containing protein n=1 Tax=Allokutzneria oryzae TaxID=1378989 RepID=A0ABV6A7A9_9PSEU